MVIERRFEVKRVFPKTKRAGKKIRLLRLFPEVLQVLDLFTPQTTSADVSALHLPVHQNAFPLQINIPATFGPVMRVAQSIPHLRLSFTNNTHSRHISYLQQFNGKVIIIANNFRKINHLSVPPIFVGHQRFSHPEYHSFSMIRIIEQCQTKDGWVPFARSLSKRLGSAKRPSTSSGRTNRMSLFILPDSIKQKWPFALRGVEGRGGGKTHPGNSFAINVLARNRIRLSRRMNGPKIPDPGKMMNGGL
jgi:hypothetical protein